MSKSEPRSSKGNDSPSLTVASTHAVPCVAHPQTPKKSLLEMLCEPKTIYTKSHRHLRKCKHSKIKIFLRLHRSRTTLTKNCSCCCKKHCANAADCVAFWFQGTRSPSFSIIIKQSPFLWACNRKVTMTVTGLPAER